MRRQRVKFPWNLFWENKTYIKLKRSITKWLPLKVIMSARSRWSYEKKWIHILQQVKSLPFHIPETWKRTPFGRLPVSAIIGSTLLYYIHTEKCSPKSYVVHFRTQISSSQSEERTMFFHVWEKWYVQSEATEVCEFRAEIPACYCSLQRIHSHTFNEKSLLKEYFSLIKWKTFRKWSRIVSFVSLSIKKTVDSRRNNSGKG